MKKNAPRGSAAYFLKSLVIYNLADPPDLTVHVIFQRPARPEDMLIPGLKIGLLRLSHLGHKVKEFLCVHSLFITFLSQFMLSWLGEIVAP